MVLNADLLKKQMNVNFTISEAEEMLKGNEDVAKSYLSLLDYLRNHTNDLFEFACKTYENFFLSHSTSRITMVNGEMYIFTVTQ